VNERLAVTACIASIACVCLAGCGGSAFNAGSEDAGPDATRYDSGSVTDGGPDTTTVDGGKDAPSDTGGPDTGSSDTGSSDTGGSDAGADTGPAVGCAGRPSVPPDAGVPPPHICSFADGGTSFPLFDKCCTTSTDCALGVYEFSCCGDTFALGFNASQAGAFQAAVAQWSCAACGCASGGLHTEDGKSAVDAGVACTGGYCMTFSQ
jgi:hypothetical protein